MSELEANKATVEAFYDLMFNQSRPREAIERYATVDRRQPMVGTPRRRRAVDPVGGRHTP